MARVGVGLTLLVASGARAAEPAPLVTVEGEEARVAVELEPEEASLLRRSAIGTVTSDRGSAQFQGYDEVCSGSCRVKLPAGAYAFSLSIDGKRVTEAQRVRIPPGDSTLRASFESHSGMRTLGWVLLATSPVTAYGTLMAFKGSNEGDGVTAAQTAVGVGVGVAQLVVGIVLVVVNKDTATFDVVPQLTSLTQEVRERRADLALPRPEQLGLSVAF